MSLISLIVFLVVVGLVFWVVKTLGATFGIPAQIITVIQVVLVVIVVLMLLQSLGVLSGSPVISIR